MPSTKLKSHKATLLSSNKKLKKKKEKEEESPNHTIAYVTRNKGI